MPGARRAPHPARLDEGEGPPPGLVAAPPLLHGQQPFAVFRPQLVLRLCHDLGQRPRRAGRAVAQYKRIPTEVGH